MSLCLKYFGGKRCRFGGAHSSSSDEVELPLTTGTRPLPPLLGPQH